MSYKMEAKTHSFKVDVSKGRIKNTEYWNGGTRFIQVIMALFFIFRAGQYAIGYNKRIDINPEVYKYTQDYWIAIFLLALAFIIIWFIEKFREKPVFKYTVSSECESGIKHVYTLNGLYENPTILTINLKDLEHIENEP